LFDVVLSIVGLLLLGWLIVLIWISNSFICRSNGFFLHKRIGLYGKEFNIIKFKTMLPKTGINTSITTADDERITRFGSFLRTYKIDELPQLFNIMKGEMSFVGPRPDVAGYADKLQGEDRIILSVRPGITGPAQLAYKDEEQILAQKNNAIKYNDEVIWPDKVRINRNYINNYSFFKDLIYIWKTIID